MLYQFLPRLSEDEYAALEASIREHGVTPGWLAAAARRGDIASRKIARKRLFTADDLAEYVERKKVGGDPVAAASRRRRRAS